MQLFGRETTETLPGCCSCGVHGWCVGWRVALPPTYHWRGAVGLPLAAGLPTTRAQAPFTTGSPCPPCPCVCRRQGDCEQHVWHARGGAGGRLSVCPVLLVPGQPGQHGGEGKAAGWLAGWLCGCMRDWPGPVGWRNSALPCFAWRPHVVSRRMGTNPPLVEAWTARVLSSLLGPARSPCLPAPHQVIKLISQVIADFADGEISQVRFRRHPALPTAAASHPAAWPLCAGRGWAATPLVSWLMACHRVAPTTVFACRRPPRCLTRPSTCRATWTSRSGRRPPSWPPPAAPPPSSPSAAPRVG